MEENSSEKNWKKLNRMKNIGFLIVVIVIGLSFSFGPQLTEFIKKLFQ